MKIRQLYVIGIAILILVLFAFLLVRLAHAAPDEGERSSHGIWKAVCMAGTWIVIENDVAGERSSHTEFSVWCARFNWETRELTWRWGLSCHPLWGVKIVIWEMGNGNPILFCRYR